MTKKVSKKKATGKSQSAFGTRLKKFLKSDDCARIRGVFYMLLAVFLLVAMVSV